MADTPNRATLLMIMSGSFQMPEDMVANLVGREVELISSGNYLHDLLHAKSSLKTGFEGGMPYAALAVEPFYFIEDGKNKELIDFLGSVKSGYGIPMIIFSTQVNSSSQLPKHYEDVGLKLGYTHDAQVEFTGTVDGFFNLKKTLDELLPK